MDVGDSPRIGKRAIGLENRAARLSSDATPLSVIWIDDAQLSRECTASAVMTAEPHLLIHAVESVEECLRRERLELELVVYYSHAEEMIDLDAIKALRTAYPRARLVVLSDASTVTPAAVRDILSHDVAGFILTRRTGVQMVVSAIRLVHSGGTFVPRDFLFMDGEQAAAPAVHSPAENGRLTPRERAVLELIRQGRPNKVIADELDMSASTVKVHVRNIMQKMDVANRTQIALGAEAFLDKDQPRRHQ